jgi:hypothetical protein
MKATGPSKKPIRCYELTDVEQTEFRAAVKPLVLLMHAKGLQRATFELNGGILAAEFFFGKPASPGVRFPLTTDH